VWAEHEAALEIFLACSRQWRVIVGMGGAAYQGLDLASVAAAMEIHAIDDRRECLYQVQQIEAGALEMLNTRG